MNKTIKSIVKYLIEIVIVAFGVFLGVYYSNVNSTNKTKEEKKKSLTLIISELEINRELLKKDIDYHEKIKLEIDSIIPTLSDKTLHTLFIGSEFKHSEIKGWNGFRFSRLQTTAFESVKTSGIIKEFDIELIQKLSNIYYFQNTYVNFGESILSKAIGINSSSKVIDFTGIIELMTSDLLNLEKNVLVALEKTIPKLKTKKSE